MVEQHKSSPPASPQLPIRHLLAVASGKGGVGKSTVSVNLALGLAKLGLKVGLLDADIYGPSQAVMLGADEGPPPIINDRIQPIEKHGVYMVSMGLLLAPGESRVWRGPMASGALQQLLFQTDWPELDLLILDLPPGTGDIQLTLVQKAPLSAGLIVTTPQDIACIDAKKAIDMFSKVHVPILGVVENMSYHQCSQCGHKTSIFGEGGGQQLTELYQCPLLAQIPLDLQVRQAVDQGEPSVVSDPAGDPSQRFLRLAGSVIEALEGCDIALPSINILND